MASNTRWSRSHKSDGRYPVLSRAAPAKRFSIYDIRGEGIAHGCKTRLSWSDGNPHATSVREWRLSFENEMRENVQKSQRFAGIEIFYTVFYSVKVLEKYFVSIQKKL
jgi:hypothetical protein